MRYFLDSEFVEDGKTIMPISLAMVCEDGRELYFEFEFDEEKAKAHPFVSEFVLPHLRRQHDRCDRDEAARRILEFVGDGPEEPEFWAWYASYDWLVVCQVFGPLIELPKHFPMFVMDLRQTMHERSLPLSLVEDIFNHEQRHDALGDARALRSAHEVVWHLVK